MTTELKQRIKRLEYEMQEDRAVLNRYYVLLRQRVCSVGFISIAMLGSFVSGFVLVHARAKKMIYAFVELPAIAMRAYANLKLLRPK
jgi:hypothetical protein